MKLRSAVTTSIISYLALHSLKWPATIVDAGCSTGGPGWGERSLGSTPAGTWEPCVLRPAGLHAFVCSHGGHVAQPSPPNPPRPKSQDRHAYGLG